MNDVLQRSVDEIQSLRGNRNKQYRCCNSQTRCAAGEQCSCKKNCLNANRAKDVVIGPRPKVSFRLKCFSVATLGICAAVAVSLLPGLPSWVGSVGQANVLFLLG